MSAFHLPLLASIAGILAFAGSASARKSGDFVKVAVEATKPDTEGNQVLTIKLAIDPAWHIYANPTGNGNLGPWQTEVTISSKVKPLNVKIAYPEGKLIRDIDFGNYLIYKGTAIITAKVRRVKGATSPVDIAIRFVVTNSIETLPPDILKVTVP